MNREEMETHFDLKRHVRAREVWPDFFVCEECAEIEATTQPSWNDGFHGAEGGRD